MNNRKMFVAVLLLILSFGNLCKAQDTLTLARQLQDMGEYQPAIKLLTAYEQNHPNQIYSKQLHAVLLYWVNEIDAAMELYESSINQFPEVNILKLEYGRMLFELGKYEKSKEQLNAYLSVSPDDVEAHLKLGWIYYYQGKFKQSREYANLVLNKYPDNADANALHAKIKKIYAPQLKIKTSYIHDSQPLNLIGSEIKIGGYQNQFFAPKLGVKSGQFEFNDSWFHSFWVRFYNASNFVKPGLAINLNTGILRHTTDTIYWTGEIELIKTFAKHLKLSAKVDRSPYYYTQASLSNPVITNNYLLSIAWDNRDEWNGLSAFMINQFADENYISTFYTWFFAPPIKTTFIDFRFGYAYNFTDAKKNNYTSVLSLEEIIAGFDPNEKIEGTYNPYFTPKNQHIHSILVGIELKFSKAFSIDINANTGVYATAKIPFLFLDIDSAGEVILAKDYFKETKVTADINVAFKFNLSSKTALALNYRYLNTFFFDSHFAGISLNMIFFNEKKR